MGMVVQCPYFIHNTKDTYIKCEAGRVQFLSRQEDDADPDKLHAEQKALRDDYMRTYCSSLTNYRNCTLAAMMEAYYEKQED